MILNMPIWATIGLVVAVVVSSMSTDSSRFSINQVHTPQDEASPLLLYNWVPDGTPMSELRALRAQRYDIVYQDIFVEGGASGIIDPEVVITHLRKILPKTFGGWGVLDFEGKFLKRLNKGPGHPEYEKTASSLIQTIRQVKREWPNSKWSFWGLPDVSYWLHNPGEKSTNWSSSSNEVKNQEFKKRAAIFQPLLEEVDWVTPWIYDLYPVDAIKNPAQRKKSAASQAAWVRAKIELAKQVVATRKKGPIPVIPMCSPLFARSENTAPIAFVPMQEFVEETLHPALNEGVDGLSVWNGISFRVKNAFREVKNQHQSKFRESAQKWLKTLLFPTQPFNWNDPGAEAQVNDKLRVHLIDQLRVMRKAMTSYAAQNEVDSLK